VRHLYEVLLERARGVPEAVAIGAQEGLGWKTLTSRELLDLVDRLAMELGHAGVQAGDRVVTWIPSHWRTPVYLFALWKLGAILVPFDREMNPEAGARIVESVEPRLVIVGYGERPAWARATQLTEWWQPGSRLQREPPNAWSPPETDLAAIFFTSGTTGNPKGSTPPVGWRASCPCRTSSSSPAGCCTHCTPARRCTTSPAAADPTSYAC
jgi:acyl-coenzyme A synthetase/AMP-(fatty) acid ligase